MSWDTFGLFGGSNAGTMRAIVLTGSGYWTVPEGVSWAVIECIGAGGGAVGQGGSFANVPWNMQAGGAGGYTKGILHAGAGEVFRYDCGWRGESIYAIHDDGWVLHDGVTHCDYNVRQGGATAIAGFYAEGGSSGANSTTPNGGLGYGGDINTYGDAGAGPGGWGFGNNNATWVFGHGMWPSGLAFYSGGFSKYGVPPDLGDFLDPTRNSAALDQFIPAGGYGVGGSGVIFTSGSYIGTARVENGANGAIVIHYPAAVGVY